MPDTAPAPAPAARSTTRRTFRANAAGLIVVTLAIVGTLVYQSASSSRPQPASSSSPSVSSPSVSSPPSAPSLGDHRRPPADADGAVTEEDGVVPDGVTVFDDEYPAVAKLDPDLLEALREAATDAAREDGIHFYVNSGWRSRDYQNQLLREAVAHYGSAKEAARWVATADTSAHVSGDAADIGSFDAAAWLGKHGAQYGLCTIYRNEPWHFELRPKAVGSGCPRPYVDPTHDPRMQQ